MTYQSRQIADNAYEITADFEGNPITFNVIVANDESEVPDLVEHHLNYQEHLGKLIKYHPLKYLLHLRSLLF